MFPDVRRSRMTPRQVAWYELFYLRRFSVTLQKIVLPVKRLQDFYRRGYLTPKHKYLHTWQNIGTNEAKR